MYYFERFLDMLHVREPPIARTNGAIELYKRRLAEQNLTPEQLYDFGLTSLALRDPVKAVAAFHLLYSQDSYRDRLHVLLDLALALGHDQGLQGGSKTERKKKAIPPLERVMEKTPVLVEHGVLSDREFKVIDWGTSYLIHFSLLKPNFLSSREPANRIHDSYVRYRNLTHRVGI